MAEYVKLKSVATRVADFASFDITPFLPEFTPDEALIEKDIQRQRSRHGQKKECDSVAFGDLVVLSCMSENEKFCKKSISIPVGKGLFSRELEEKLVGLEVGKEHILTVGESSVTLCVEKAVRTVLPELRDEVVASWGMEGVDSVAALRRFCINRQIEAMLPDCEEADMASAAVWRFLSDNSEVILDEQELAEARKEAEEKLAELGSMDTTEDGPDMTQMVHDMFMTGLKMGAIGQRMAEDAGALLTADDYESYVRVRMEAFPDKTEAEIRAKYIPAEFSKYQYGDNVAQMLDQFIAESFKRGLNP